ncbi:MAG: hypothetical protein ABI790_14525 [Betaproteobacteria bacterium]
MNPAKINALLDTLKAACIRQFRFNPRRVAAGMRYVRSEGHGANLVHVFRDSHTHSQIELKMTMATLRETHEDKAHWSDAEKARYRHTDAEMDAEIAARKAELEFTQQCALYRDHREQLLSRYKDWPTYQPGGPTAREAARTLIGALSDANDPRLTAFAEHLHTSDPEELTHLLLAPCHLEIEALARQAV